MTIEFDRVSVTYPGASLPALVDASFVVPDGELCLVIGPTGAGKSTLLKAACGLVPHFTGGVLAGRVTVDGRDTRTTLPRDLADVVGVVVQDPAAGFVTDTVEDELAYAMEQLAVPAGVMRQRVEEVLDLLGLAALRARPLAGLSGGEQQRAAIGAVLTARPRILVLDEPTSALDPAAAEDVLAALTRLVHDLGMTVVLAEHRLERVVQYADRMIAVDADGRVVHGSPLEVLRTSSIAPPIVHLGRLAGWDPLPLSVRDARRRAPALRSRLAAAHRDQQPPTVDGREAVAGWVLRSEGVHVHHGRTHAVCGVDLCMARGEVVALMGRNGSGKTSLLWALQGSGPRSAGRVRMGLDGTVDPADCSPEEARRHVALVPQNPLDLLFLPTVAAECRRSDEAYDEPGRTRGVLDTLSAGIDPDGHPRDLSEGQRLALALAIQMAARPELLMLDEPTRGLDYPAKRRLGDALTRLAATGAAILLSSHDVEFVAECARRVVVLADGAVVADGPTDQVLTASPTFAPQVARILHPLPLLTVAAVRQELESA
jgi:energy-coupling factor transport system ATP-binding protein